MLTSLGLQLKLESLKLFNIKHKSAVKFVAEWEARQLIVQHGLSMSNGSGHPLVGKGMPCFCKDLKERSSELAMHPVCIVLASVFGPGNEASVILKLSLCSVNYGS